MVIPLIFDILTIYFGMYMPDYGTLLMMVLAWAPVVNPVITLSLVNQYRESILLYFRCCGSSSKVEVQHITPSNISNRPIVITY
uniref:G protein-coupled receptor n=1 Tax=Panagrolaimus sp. ES5 TaxID=591445 RepID=A0AC34F6E5_9BILA